MVMDTNTEPHAVAKSKRQRSPSLVVVPDKAEEDVLAWLFMEECWFPNTNTNSNASVRFIEDPYSSLLVVQSSSSYITINGNEESCGSSFSDSGTSLMASLDKTGFTPKPKDESMGVGIGMDGCDDAFHVLARFLVGVGEDQDVLPLNSQL